jgi:hypothetical protein
LPPWAQEVSSSNLDAPTNLNQALTAAAAYPKINTEFDFVAADFLKFQQLSKPAEIYKWSQSQLSDRETGVFA